MKLSKLYEILGLAFEGSDVEISGLNSLSNAMPDELSYCDGEKNAKFIEDW